jgi:hypothetical protein
MKIVSGLRCLAILGGTVWSVAYFELLFVFIFVFGYLLVAIFDFCFNIFFIDFLCPIDTAITRQQQQQQQTRTGSNSMNDEQCRLPLVYYRHVKSSILLPFESRVKKKKEDDWVWCGASRSVASSLLFYRIAVVCCFSLYSCNDEIECTWKYVSIVVGAYMRLQQE